MVLLAGSKCMIAGWGKTEYGYPHALQQVKIPIMNKARCKRNYSFKYAGMITDVNFCAGEEGKDSCFVS